MAHEGGFVGVRTGDVFHQIGKSVPTRVGFIARGRTRGRNLLDFENIQQGIKHLLSEVFVGHQLAVRGGEDPRTGVFYQWIDDIRNFRRYWYNSIGSGLGFEAADQAIVFRIIRRFGQAQHFVWPEPCINHAISIVRTVYISDCGSDFFDLSGVKRQANVAVFLATVDEVRDVVGKDFARGGILEKLGREVLHVLSGALSAGTGIDAVLQIVNGQFGDGHMLDIDEPVESGLQPFHGGGADARGVKRAPFFEQTIEGNIRLPVGFLRLQLRNVLKRLALGRESALGALLRHALRPSIGV